MMENLTLIYRNCPRKFIPKSIIQFMLIFDFLERHPSSPVPSIDQISARYFFAEIYFKNQLLEYKR